MGWGRSVLDMREWMEWVFSRKLVSILRELGRGNAKQKIVSDSSISMYRSHCSSKSFILLNIQKDKPTNDAPRYFQITPFLPVIIGSSWGRCALSSPLRPIMIPGLAVKMLILVFLEARSTSIFEIEAFFKRFLTKYWISRSSLRVSA